MKHVHERRTGKDRRQRDVDLFGNMERRRRVEARKPEIVEIALSETEWEDQFGRRSVKSRTSLPLRVGILTRLTVTRAQITRSGVDRRQEDRDPPGLREQRKKAELRKPEVVEMDLTASEWSRQFGHLDDAEFEHD